MSHERRTGAPDRRGANRPAALAVEVGEALYVVRLEPDLELEYISPAVESISGIAPAEHYAASHAGLGLIDPRDAGVLGAAFAAGLGETATCTVRWLSRDGRESWAEHRCRRVLRADGSVVVYGAARDVTRAHAEAMALAASEERYRRLAENSSDIVFRVRPDGLLEWVSPSIESILGWDPAALIGTRPWELVHPDDRARAADAFAAAAHPNGEGRFLEFRGRHKDGGYRWMSAHGRPELSEGYVNGFVVALRDVDDQVHARAALARSERDFRLLASNATDLVVRTGPDQRITWASPTVTRTLGWEPGDLEGLLLADLVHPDDQATSEDLRSRVHTDERTVAPADGYLIRMRSKSGTYHWMSGTYTPVVNDDGRPDGAITGLRHVDDLVEARQAAEKDRMRMRATLDSLLDPHLLIRAVRDDRGRIIDFTVVDANSAACDYKQVTHEHLVGTTLLQSFPGVVASGLLDRLVESMASGDPLVLDDFAYLAREVTHSDRWYDFRGVRFDDGLSFTWRDVTDRHLAVVDLASSEEQYRLLAENASDVVIRVEDGTIVWVSPSLADAVGWTALDWIGHLVSEFVYPDDLDQVTAEHARLPLGHTRVARLRVRSREGSYHWTETHSRPYVDASGARRGLVIAARIVDSEVAAEEELERRATHDALTGALNRSEVFHRLGLVRGRRRRRGDAYAVVFLDLDELKAVNDGFGHAAGDEVLRMYARRIRQSVRRRDLVARVGGDEFLTVLDGVHDIEEARTLADKIRLNVAAPVTIPGGTVASTASVGVALAATDESVEAVVARADRAMYQVKRSGGDRVVALAKSGRAADAATSLPGDQRPTGN